MHCPDSSRRPSCPLTLFRILCAAELANSLAHHDVSDTEVQQLKFQFVEDTIKRSFKTKAHLNLFEFIEHDQAVLSAYSDKPGLLLAGEGLLRHLPGCKRPKGWRKAVDGFGRRTEDRRYTLRAIRIGNYWHVVRRTTRSNMSAEYFAFDELPICTRTEQEAMCLADRCHSDPGPAMGGCWVRAFK